MLLNFVLIGLIWTLIDVFLIGGMVREERDKMRHRYATDMLVHGYAG